MVFDHTPLTPDRYMRNLKLKEAKKFDTKPKDLNKNKRTSATFRSRAYGFNTLPHRITSIEDPKTFSKWAKVFIQNPQKVPKKIPLGTKDTHPKNKIPYCRPHQNNRQNSQSKGIAENQSLHRPNQIILTGSNLDQLDQSEATQHTEDSYQNYNSHSKEYLS